MEKALLEKLYLGKRVHVIYNKDGQEIDRWGTVLKVDSTGKLIGTWGDYKISPSHDYISTED